MTDDKQDPSVVAWRFNDALNPSREPLFTDKPYVADVWGSAHGTVTPLSPAIDLTAMKAELEELREVVAELDRLYLIIEAAVRWADQTNLPKIAALFKMPPVIAAAVARRAALSKPKPRAAQRHPLRN